MFPEKKISSHSRLGFIGLGYLGSRIARRLAAAGFSMVVYNRNREKTRELASLGAAVAQDPAELAATVDVVLTCLADGPSVKAVYRGAGEVLRSARPGTRIIDLSTVAPETSQQLHQAAARLEIPMLDVPVSGSTAAAEAGTLTLFGGGEREDFDAAEPIFAAIASQYFYMGPSGSGAVMKLVVNSLLGVGMQAIAEALALGSALGLSRDLLYDTLARTAVVAPALGGKLAAAKRQDYTPQFPVRLMRKDFGMILAAAAASGLSMPATEAAAGINTVEAVTGGEEDFSAVIRQMEQRAGVESLPPAA